MVTALETHDIDFSYSIPVASVPIFDGNKEITLSPLEGIRINWLTMNTQKPPFDNKLVRQAMNYAINREFINDTLFDGLAFPMDIMATDNMFGKPETYEGYEYSPEKAKELLKEAGYPDGFVLNEKILTTNSHSKAAEMIMQNLAEVGVTVEIEQLEFGTYIQNLYAGNFICAMGGYFMITPDVDTPLQMYKSANIGAMNTAQYSNEEVDKLSLAACLTNNNDERKELYKKIFDIVQDESAYAIYSNDVEILAYDANLKITNLNSRNTLVFDMSW